MSKHRSTPKVSYYANFDKEREHVSTSLERDRQMTFVKNVEAVLKGYKEYKPDAKLLSSLLQERGGFEIDEFYSRNIVQDMTDYFQAGITQKNSQMNVNFMELVRKVFMMLTAKHKSHFATMFVQRWQSFDTDYTPYFESISRNFDANLQQAIQALSDRGAHTDPELFEQKVLHVIRWSIVVSPPETLRKLFMKCLEDPQILLLVTSICEFFPTLFYEKKLKMWNSQFEVKVPEEFLLIAVLRRVILDGRARITNSEHWDNFYELVVALTTPRFDEPPLVQTVHVLELLFTELASPNRNPMKSVEAITRTAAKLLDLENPVAFKIVFATSRRDQPHEGVFLTPTVIDLMLRLFGEFDGVSKDMMRYTKHILKALGRRMRLSREKFLYETRSRMLQQDFREIPWYMEFSMQSWFVYSLKLEKRRVHAAIYDVLAEADQIHFERGDGFDFTVYTRIHSPVDAYFTALFELAVFDVKMAVKLFRIGTTFEYRNLNAEEVLLRALRGCKGHKMALSEAETTLFQGLFRAIVPAMNGTISEHETHEIVEKLMDQFPPAAPRVPYPIQPAELVYPSVILSALDDLLPSPFLWPESKFVPPGVTQDDLKVHYAHQLELREKVAEREAVRAERIRRQWEEEGAYTDPCYWKHNLKDFADDLSDGPLFPDDNEPSNYANPDEWVPDFDLDNLDEEPAFSSSGEGDDFDSEPEDRIPPYDPFSFTEEDSDDDAEEEQEGEKSYAPPLAISFSETNSNDREFSARRESSGSSDSEERVDIRSRRLRNWRAEIETALEDGDRELDEQMEQLESEVVVEIPEEPPLREPVMELQPVQPPVQPPPTFRLDADEKGEDDYAVAVQLDNLRIESDSSDEEEEEEEEEW